MKGAVAAIAAGLLLLIRIDKTTDLPGLFRDWKVCLVCGVIGTALPNAATGRL